MLKGPTIFDIFSNPSAFNIVSWVLSIIASGIALFIFYPHYQKILACPNTHSKRHTLRVLYMTPSFAILSLLGLFFPRTSALFAVLRSVVESRAIYGYVALLLDELGGFDKAVQSMMSMHDSGKFLAVPPCCCCLRPCCPTIPMSSRLISFCRKLAMQAVYAIPILAYLHLWVELEKVRDHASYYDNVIITIQALEVLTVMFAFWGMMILFFASREVIASFNPGRKMIAIKLVLFVGVVQTFVLSLSLSSTSGNNDLYDQAYEVTAWSNFLLCLESAPLALLMRWSYPARELQFEALNSIAKDTYGAVEVTSSI